MKNLVSVTFCMIFSISVFAQNHPSSVEIEQTAYEKTFVIKPAVSVYYSTPQKYGLQGEIYMGNRFEEVSDSTYRLPHRHIFLKSVSLEGGYNRGGYNVGITYSKLSAYIGTMGLKYGIFYYSNNSYSSVKKRQTLAGAEISLHLATFELSTGVLKGLNEDVYIPVLGFGIRFGPALYD